MPTRGLRRYNDGMNKLVSLSSLLFLTVAATARAADWAEPTIPLPPAPGLDASPSLDVHWPALEIGDARPSRARPMRTGTGSGAPAGVTDLHLVPSWGTTIGRAGGAPIACDTYRTGGSCGLTMVRCR